MALENKVINQVTREQKFWRAEITVLVAIMDGEIGTNAQRNTLRRMIKQNAAVLNQAAPAQVHAALKKLAEVSRIAGIAGTTPPKISLGQFVNQRHS
jgi:hypothetical protein